MQMRTEEAWLELKEFILFCKRENVPSFKLDGFECTIPTHSPSLEKLAALERDIEQLKQVCSRLMLALEAKQFTGNPATPFANRVKVNAVGSNG